MIRGVLFSLFETLITEYEPDHEPSESSPLIELFGDRIEEFESYWRRNLVGRHTGTLGNYRDILVAACREFAIVPDPRLVREANARRIAAKAEPFKLVDTDVAHMVEQLRAARIKLGVVSNCEQEAIMAWPQWRISSYFQKPVFSCQVKIAKPDPRIYRLACNNMAIPPKEVLFVGDGDADEILGAMEAGLRACHCTWFLDQWPFERPRNIGDAPVLGSPQQLVDLIRAENGV